MRIHLAPAIFLVLFVAAGCSSADPTAPSDPVSTTKTTGQRLGDTTQVIYDDALQNGWGDGSWDTRLDYASTATVFSGSSAISAQFSAWGGVLLAHAAFDTSAFTTLRFHVNGGDTGGKAIEAFVKLPGNVNGAFVDIGSHCDGGSIPANQWVKCEISLADLGAASTTITAVVLQEWSGTSLSTTYFDQIELASATAAPPPPSPPPPPPPPLPAGNGGTGGNGGASGGAFRGDSKPMPSFGGWAWGNDPADAIARAGFDWFETGYPGDTATNQTLIAAGVRPFAYINLGELDPSLASQANYDGPVLRTNGDWGTQLVDVTNQSWQDWLVRRANYAYDTGSRGVKWDVATPDIPPGKNRGDVNNAIAAVMQRVLASHPDMKLIYNQGMEFGLAYPQYVNGMETEGLFSASSYPAAYLQPWNDPWYWGPQYQQMKQLHQMGIPIFCAEYVDPYSQSAKDLYSAIVGQNFVPYITNVDWNIRGWGLNVPPGW